MSGIEHDPRFVQAIALFNEGDYLEASDLFEELYFEGVRDEPDFIRIFMQYAVGIHHAQTGQRRPAIERVEVGLNIVLADDRGIDLLSLREAMRSAIEDYAAGRKPAWPRISTITL